MKTVKKITVRDSLLQTISLPEGSKILEVYLSEGFIVLLASVPFRSCEQAVIKELHIVPTSYPVPSQAEFVGTICMSDTIKACFIS